MNDLNVTRQSLGEWLRDDACFIIPPYQRKYCWRRENCENLFEDLLKVAERERPTHFFGTITLSPLADGQFYVVDGQQKLATLWLFAHFVGRVLNEGNGDLPRSNRLAKRLTFEDPHDQKTWRHLLLDRFCDEESLNNEMADNASWLRKEVEASNDALRLAHTEQRLLEKLLLVRVVLPSKLAPQRIFERMNGVKLEITPMDLIKNFLLMKCNAEEEQEVHQLWENKFRQLEWMFRNLVEALVGADVYGTDLYRKFRQIFESDGFGPECGHVPALLAQCRTWFEAFHAAYAIFERLTGGHGLPSRYRTLIMRTAMVFSGDQADARRRNSVLAEVTEHIFRWIASNRLRINRLHYQSDDSRWCHACLKSFNESEPTAERFEATISHHIASIAREECERGFNSWIQHEEPRPTRNWYILGLGEDAAKLDAGQMTDRLEMRFQERRQTIGE
jgi:hypothetical protein